MASMEDGRRRYRRQYGNTTQTRFEAMDDSPMNRGALTAAARRGDATARRKLQEWKEKSSESGGVQFEGAPTEPAEVKFGNAE